MPSGNVYRLHPPANSNPPPLRPRRRAWLYVVTWLILLAIGEGYLLWLAMAEKPKPTVIHLRGTVR